MIPQVNARAMPGAIGIGHDPGARDIQRAVTGRVGVIRHAGAVKRPIAGNRGVADHGQAIGGNEQTPAAIGRLVVCNRAVVEGGRPGSRGDAAAVNGVGIVADNAGIHQDPAGDGKAGAHGAGRHPVVGNRTIRYRPVTVDIYSSAGAGAVVITHHRAPELGAAVDRHPAPARTGAHQVLVADDHAIRGQGIGIAQVHAAAPVVERYGDAMPDNAVGHHPGLHPDTGAHAIIVREVRVAFFDSEAVEHGARAVDAHAARGIIHVWIKGGDDRPGGRIQPAHGDGLVDVNVGGDDICAVGDQHGVIDAGFGHGIADG